MHNEKDFVVRDYNNRQDLRRIIVSKFLEEEPGLGSGSNTSRYRYNVEKLGDGSKIYLTRPAYLKKGFDFRINVENMIFLTRGEYPKHDDIFNDLYLKRKSSHEMARRLYEAIKQVYECKDPEDILPEYSDITFDTGYSVEMILKLVKWLFIEQDIRDWNYSGRAMFMSGVETILL